MTEYKEVSREELIQEVKRLSKEHHNGEKPTVKTLKKHSDYTRNDIRKHFEKWGDLVKEIGFKINNEEIKDEDKIYDELQKVNKIVGRPPRMYEFNNHSEISAEYVSKEYGTWVNALEENGIQPDTMQYRNISKKEFICDYKRLVKQTGRIITLQEYQEKGEFDNSTIRKRFDSWKQFVRECGYEAVGRPKGEDHYNWDGGWERYYGESWYSQRKKCLERDNYRCRVCLKTQKDIGRKQDVHHIEPKHKFDVEEEHEKMNSLDNLVCLCKSCHTLKIDGKWQNKKPKEWVEKAKQYHDI